LYTSSEGEEENHASLKPRLKKITKKVTKKVTEKLPRKIVAEKLAKPVKFTQNQDDTDLG